MAKANRPRRGRARRRAARAWQRVRATRGWQALVRFWHKAYGDGITGLAGMVAYNLLLSLLPLTLLALFIFGQVVQSREAEASVISDIHRLLPSTEGNDLNGLLREIRRSSTSIGIAALLSSVWIGSSFWGSIDTAFCRIYHSKCRSWLQQKRFSLVMLVVVLLMIAATIALPAIQSAVAQGADDLPFGLSARRAVYVVTLVASVVVLFVSLAVVYHAVPNAKVPWTAVWPGAAAATVAIALVDFAFPLYLQGSPISSFGGTYVFVLIVLLWFYAIALILLGGAVINALRFERLTAPAARS